MGVLDNQREERFCQELRRILRDGKGVSAAQAEAYVAAGFSCRPANAASNGRRLAQKARIKARILEIGEQAAKLANIDAAWALVELRDDAERVKSFNLDDYLAPEDGRGERHFSLKGVSRDKIGLLSELAQDEEFRMAGAGEEAELMRIRKMRLKGPNRIADRVAIFSLMAKIAGWMAPEKSEHAVSGPVVVQWQDTAPPDK